MIREHWYPTWGEPPEVLLNGSHPAADGKLHRVIEAHGGVATHLEKMWNYAAGVHHWKPKHELHGLSLVPPKSALWVNFRGKRLGPPPLVSAFDTRYLVETICREEKKYSWQILNRKIMIRELAISGAEHNTAIRDKKKLKFYRTILRGNRPLVKEFIEECPDCVIADSVPELVEKMNRLQGNSDVDAELLAEEIRTYDANIGRGKTLHNDDQLRRIAHTRQYIGDRMRTCKFQRIDDPKARPLVAIREFILTRKSLGGIQTDLGCRVLDKQGEPLPGLYAVGETAGFGGGGIHGLRALEGTFLGTCVFTGRIAAQAIALG
jgi:predicted oxidoreductase